MKRIFEYSDYFKQELWHVHTIYTDGSHTVDELCCYAVKNGFRLICFAEHVRREIDYDFDQLMDDIHKARRRYHDLIILSGVEAKILLDGQIDCHQEIIDAVDILFLAEHGFNGDFNTYLQSLLMAFDNQDVQVWAHPLLLPFKKGWKIMPDQVEIIKNICQTNDIVIEENKRYEMLGTQGTFSDYPYILNGYDLHTIE